MFKRDTYPQLRYDSEQDETFFHTGPEAEPIKVFNGKRAGECPLSLYRVDEIKNLVYLIAGNCFYHRDQLYNWYKIRHEMGMPLEAFPTFTPLAEVTSYSEYYWKIRSVWRWFTVLLRMLFVESLFLSLAYAFLNLQTTQVLRKQLKDIQSYYSSVCHNPVKNFHYNIVREHFGFFTWWDVAEAFRADIGKFEFANDLHFHTCSANGGTAEARQILSDLRVSETLYGTLKANMVTSSVMAWCVPVFIVFVSAVALRAERRIDKSNFDKWFAQQTFAVPKGLFPSEETSQPSAHAQPTGLALSQG